MDQALIDYAVSHGYTREEAIAHFGKKQSSDSPSADWALKQGQQNIANQPAALENLKEPDVKNAVTQMVPAAANTAKAMATNMFQGLNTNDESMGALEAAGAYGIYKTLKDKFYGGNTPPPPPPPPPAVAPAAPATPAAPAAPVQTLQQRLGLVPKVELSPEELRKQKLTAAGAAAEQQMKANAAPISAEGATPLIPAVPAPTDTPPVKIEPPPAPPAPEQTPVEKVVELTKEALETPKVAGAVEPLQTGTGKPAYAGEGPTTGKFKSSYPDVKSVPQGYAFVPGAQSINTLRNNIGQETFTEHYTKNPYPATYEEALQQGKDINKSLGRMTRDELKAAGIAPPNVVPGIGAQVGGVKGARLIKVGGTAGMLVALSDLAKADSLNEARSIAGETALGLMPPGAQAMLYMKGAGEGENADMAFRRRMEAAKQLGAGNRGKAFDPRIPYNSALSDIGIPPPYGR